MKQLSIMLGAALFGAISLSSCKKEFKIDYVPMPEGEMCTLTVNASTIVSTKVTDVSKDNTISDIQIFVFKDGVKEAYTKVNGLSASIECTAGVKDVVVVANGPDYKNITSKDALLNTFVDLSANAANKLVMVGTANPTLPVETPVNVEVSRLVSRVAIHKITRQFDASVAGVGFKISRIYLHKASKSGNLGKTQFTGYYNDGDTKTDCAPLLSETPNANLANNGAHDVNYYFYTMPALENVCSLVVEAVLDGKTVYYSVPLPAMEGNKSYEIANLTVKHFGTDEPGEVVEVSAIDFSISVKGWDIIPVEEPNI